jgi:limonene 1,2-monooxygenase
MDHLRFGIFMPPMHQRNENPTLCYARDMQVLEHLDALGYDEAWIGEHHSGGAELIASPELFVAAAAERTKRIRLGTGVNSLPYHHPLILADRWMQLHHMTQGRAMFGCGPGALVSEAMMMGIPADKQRDRMDEALACIVRLMRGETVTYKCDWFELNEARLQLRPYGNQPLDICAAAMVSPAGPRSAGRHGVGLLSMGATSPTAVAAAGTNWSLACETAAQFGHAMDRSKWRMMGMMHVAETREQARKDVEYGLMHFINYFETIGILPLVPPNRKGDAIDYMIESGLAVIGTPDDCMSQIDMLWNASDGGFGCYLITDLNWAPFQAKLKSYELIARYVFARVQNHNPQRDASEAWLAERRPQFAAAAQAAMQAQIARLEHDRARAAAAE